jgi:hypothetical protein
MPRVNRDLQRRMAARRERERRRPGGERRYNFARAEPALEPDETSVEQDEETTEAVVDEAPSRSSRSAIATPKAPAPAKAGARATKPFSAYKDEYTYVYGDLRRVGLVIGSLLVILIVLYFVLPLLVR